jgi:hypothetical protein
MPHGQTVKRRPKSFQNTRGRSVDAMASKPEKRKRNHIKKGRVSVGSIRMWHDDD